MDKIKTLHLLHIGKTGGTAIKYALKTCLEPPSFHINFHKHHTRLTDIPEGEKVFFFLRDPMTRFVSGFYSRLRQGRPRYYFPLLPDEQRAFNHFKTPKSLAVALNDRNNERRAQAESAMHAIGHVNTSFWDWLCSETYIMSRVRDLFFIGFQETLATDFEHLRGILNLSHEVSLPTDALVAHRNPEGLDKSLCALSRANLKDWYASDYRCLRMCQALSQELLLRRC